MKILHRPISGLFLIILGISSVVLAVKELNRVFDMIDYSGSGTVGWPWMLVGILGFILFIAGFMQLALLRYSRK